MKILLLHGALGTKDQLSSISEALFGHEVRKVEFSGHGERDIPEEGLSFEDFIRNIDDAMDGAGFAEAHLFGYSMGGYAALLYAHRFPTKVLSVATLGTKLLWDREGMERELRMLDPQRMKEKVPDFAMHLLLQHGEAKWEPLVRSTSRLIQELYEDPPLGKEVFQEVECPVLLCVGDRDRTAGPEHTMAVQRLLPNAGTAVLPFTPHPFNDADLHTLITHLQIFWGVL